METEVFPIREEPGALGGVIRQATAAMELTGSLQVEASCDNQQYLFESLVRRPDGSFLVTLELDSSQEAQVINLKGSLDPEGNLVLPEQLRERYGCPVSPELALEIMLWFDVEQSRLQKNQRLEERRETIVDVLTRHGLDFENIERARIKTIIERGLDDDGIRAKIEALLREHWFDAESINLRRAECLKEAGLDDESIAAKRQAVLTEHGLTEPQK